MMRIAFILPSLANRGPILVVKDLVAQLQLMGYSCRVFYFDELPGIEFPVEVQRLSFKSKFNFEGFDVVHSHGLRPDIFIYKNRAEIKGHCLTTMHNIIFEEYKSAHNILMAWLVQTIWIFFLKRHDALVCLTQQMRTYYQRFFRSKALFVVYNGRGINNFSKLPVPEIEEIERFKAGYTILGSACVVTRRKGLHQVIKALPLLKDYAFILIGDGPELEHLKALAKSYGVEDRCLFLGRIDQAERFYGYFDLFVMSSYTEGVPLSLLESAAIKLPAICSDIPVLKEIFTEKEVSFFTLDNVQSFVTATKQAILNRSSYAAAMHLRYLEKYTSEGMAIHYGVVYKELMDKTKNL